MDGGGNLYVADKATLGCLNTTLRLPMRRLPCVGGAANRVFGQGGSFTSSDRNNSGVTAIACTPRWGSAGYGGNLYVADDGNNRVLEYDTPVADDTTADLVFGQGGSFTSNTTNNGGVSADSLCSPLGLQWMAAATSMSPITYNYRVL